MAEEELDHAVRQIISRAVAPGGVLDIFAAAGLAKPDISIPSDEFLAEVRGMPQRNLAVDLLQKLLKGELALARPQVEIHGYRALFDLRPTDDGVEPIDLRLYLRLGHEALTETWGYHWTPPPTGERSRWLTLGPALR